MLLPQTLYLIEACNNIYSNPPSLFSPIQLRTFLRFLIHSTTADTSSSISPFACTPLTNALPGPANPHIAVACLWIHGCDIRCLCPAATAAATYGLSLSWLFLQPPQQPLTGCLCPAATAAATYGLPLSCSHRSSHLRVANGRPVPRPGFMPHCPRQHP